MAVELLAEEVRDDVEEARRRHRGDERRRRAAGGQSPERLALRADGPDLAERLRAGLGDALHGAGRAVGRAPLEDDARRAPAELAAERRASDDAVGLGHGGPGCEVRAQALGLDDGAAPEQLRVALLEGVVPARMKRGVWTRGAGGTRATHLRRRMRKFSQAAA